MDKSLYLHPARKQRMKRPEQVVQIGIMSHLVPLMKFKPFMVIAIPNGGYRTKAEAGILKAMGQMDGATDFMLLFPGKIILDNCTVTRREPPATVWVELKIKSIKYYKRGARAGQPYDVVTPMSDEQKTFRDRVVAMGFDHRVVYALDINDGLNQTLKIMKEYGVE